MKKFFTQQINFAYAVIVMLALVIGVSGINAASIQQSSGYGAPGEVIPALIHQGGGDQAISGLRISDGTGTIGTFDTRGVSGDVALFDATTTGGFFAALEDALFLGYVYVADDIAAARTVWTTAQGPNNLIPPMQRVNVDGDALITSLAHSGTSEDVCVTVDGTIVLCPDTTLGSCGAAAGHTYSVAPSSNLCSAGTASSVTTNTSTYDWTCTGTGGSVSCQANRATAVNGSCGAADGHSYATPPTSNLCSGGNASAVTTNSTTYDWTCDGTNGGIDDTCQATRILETDAQCAVFNSGPYNSQPATNSANGCAPGTYTDIADTSSNWQWSCLGLNGGADVSPCTAERPAAPVDGVCNNSVQNGCSAGTPNDGAFADTSSHWRWRCDGINSGADSGMCEKAIPQNGLCRTDYTGGPYEDQPATNNSTGCVTGDYANSPADTSTDWKWSCLGTDGGTDDTSCTAPMAGDPECFDYFWLVHASQPATNDATGCLDGTYSDGPSDTDNQWRWTCTDASTSITCAAHKDVYELYTCDADPWTGPHGSCQPGEVYDCTMPVGGWTWGTTACCEEMPLTQCYNAGGGN